MGLSFFVQSTCLFSLLVSLTLVVGDEKRVFDVTNYGARGDGRTDNSKAFIDAWNGACQNIGGGTVLFPKAGTFMVAPVVLRDIAVGFCHERKHRQHNIAQQQKHPHQSFRTQGVFIPNVKILAPGNSPNNDGIHIGSSQNIYIVDSHISTGDDCVSVLPRSKYINVTGVQCGPGQGISIGSLGKGDGDTVTDLYATNSGFTGTQNGVRIKTWSVNSKPGSVSRVAFEHIEMAGQSHHY
ncbi:probable polygalacturonase At2g43860 [Argentina anserina]|uniref:probable polygalacturonase At2g43860 n=1 Tax=Argentina anserina TaxID=57926 RepID=UPI00217674C1|nr:probable polygalacturonase At2g43860 [Potentilla anserina]